MRILFASTNLGKFVEVKEEASKFGYCIVTPELVLEKGDGNKLDILRDTMPVVDESMDSYLGNARLKAAAFNAWSGLPSLADDTGLEVAALGGRPGVYSARYSGPNGDAQQNISKLLLDLRGVVDRQACFKCALSLYFGNQEKLNVVEELPGEIIDSPSGEGGFGYDSIFYLPEFKMTLAQLKEKRIGVVTHRGKACRSLFAKLGPNGLSIF